MQARTEQRRTKGRPRKTHVDGMEEIARKNGTVEIEVSEIAGGKRLEQMDRGSFDAVRHKGWRKKKKITLKEMYQLETLDFWLRIEIIGEPL